MASNTERCEKLRTLRVNVLKEIASLQRDLAQEKEEGVGNPVEVVSVIKSLQETLTTIDLQLQNCPPIA